MTDVISPEDFFGFRLGSDRKIARWDRIVKYFNKLQEQSDKIRVVDMGLSTEGNPFLLVIISSPENLSKLERLRDVNLSISDPRGLSEEEVEAYISEGRAVICQSMSLHATEIGGTQMAPELAYDLLTRDDEETKRILDNVVFLMVPCFNPDGQIMVTDWYTRWLGTEYEGVGLPWLYHKYGGHDNNRDAFQTNMVESKYVASVLFRDWIPQAYVDHHHMGSYGARLYIPPYTEPFRPLADPLVYREHAWYGAHMAYRLEEAGKIGIIGGGSPFPAWGHFGWHRITNHHNISGMLTESASAKLATPLYIHRGQLKGDHFSFPEYEAQVNFPHPWPGGLWRLREIVEQIKIVAWATLDLAARYRETVLRNAYLKAKRQTERGALGNPKAYLVPRDQHDPLTAVKMIAKLLDQGVEIHLACKPFEADGAVHPEGTYVISLAQPKYGLIRSLLGRTFYPDGPWTRDGDGTPRRPKDKATDTMAEFMGVRVIPVDRPIEAELEKISEPAPPEGRVLGESAFGYALDCRLNDSYAAVNRLLASGASVWRAKTPVNCGGTRLPLGSFVVEDVGREDLERMASETHVTIHPLTGEVREKTRVSPPKIGVYQRYYGGNSDEGWTRLVLEQFGFPYKTLMDDDVKKGSLSGEFSVVVIPNDEEALITGENLRERALERGRVLPEFPPEYRSGTGREGVENLREFVENGGTFVCVNQSCEFAINEFGLNVRDALKGVQPKEFFCPGSTLRASVDPCHPLGHGMPRDSLIFFLDSPAFEILPSGNNADYEVVVSYGKRDMLESGWLIGEEKLKRKAAMVVARHGRGRVVLFGFRPQHRAQTHGTYKLLFNSLLG